MNLHSDSRWFSFFRAEDWFPLKLRFLVTPLLSGPELPAQISKHEYAAGF